MQKVLLFFPPLDPRTPLLPGKFSIRLCPGDTVLFSWSLTMAGVSAGCSDLKGCLAQDSAGINNTKRFNFSIKK